MRRALFAFASLSVLTLHAQTQDALDTLFLNDAAGSQRTGHIVGVDENSFKLSVPLAAGGAATATVSVPRSEVDRIEFAPSEAREKLLADPTASAAALNVEWHKWEPYLGVSRSPAPQVANAFANALLKNPSMAPQALTLFSRVEAEAWDEDAKHVARQGRLRAMVATGQAEAAVDEARKLAEESEDPSVLIEAKFILAEAAFAKLKRLVDDNPRWNEDVFVRPEYYRLYNESLDLYLHPALFLGSEIDAASRGLWGAVQVYRFGGDENDAVESAKDIVMLYPGTRYATLGQQYLDSVSKNSKANENNKDDDN